ARMMRPQKRGKIVLTASVMGMRTTSRGGAHAYSAAKAGVISLARSAALSLAPDGIRVNAMAPGFVATPIWGLERSEVDANPQMLEMAQRQPLGRWAEPEEVAAL